MVVWRPAVSLLTAPHQEVSGNKMHYVVVVVVVVVLSVDGITAVSYKLMVQVCVCVCAYVLNRRYITEPMFFETDGVLFLPYLS